MDEDWTDLGKPQMLTQRVTLDEYFAESMALVQAGRLAASAIDRDRAQLEARARPQDQWWAWLLGTEPLRQIGGLALVRDGNIIWARSDWIS